MSYIQKQAEPQLSTVLIGHVCELAPKVTSDMYVHVYSLNQTWFVSMN